MLCVATIGMHFGLTREAEEFLVSGGEVLVFIAEQEHLSEVALGMGFHFGNAVQHGAFEIGLRKECPFKDAEHKERNREQAIPCLGELGLSGV